MVLLGGGGGELLKADQAEAIFRAPVLEDKEIELFVIQLTAQYEGQEPGTAQLHVRVLKELPEKTVQQQQAEDEMVSYIKGLSKKQKKKLAKQYRKQARGRTVVVQNNPYPSWHFGFSWGWGWPVHYPIYVPIIVPPPGGEWLPGEGEWPEPAPLPYDEIVNDFPSEIDAWDSRLETLAKAMPAGEAARLVAAMEAVSESTVSIWQLEPALSNPPSP